MWRNHFFNREGRGVWRAAIWFAACSPLFAQTVSSVQISSPQDILLCGRSVQLTASALDFYGATIGGFAPQWQSLSPAIATVDQNGNVQGLLPGVAAITVSDPASGLGNSYYLRVQPLRIDVTPAHPVLHVGDSIQLAAAALDADGKPLTGVRFVWTSGVAGIAAVANDGTVSALKSGSVTVSAAIDAGTAGLDFSSDIQVNVYRKPDYKLTALVSSDDPGSAAALQMPKMISAAGDAYVATIGDLSSGAQGLILSVNGVPRLLGSSGQVLPGPNKVINRFTGVSVNSAGDVVAAVQFPAEWCDSALVLYHQGNPPALLDAGCNIGITDRALGNNGDVVYFLENNGNHFYIHHSDGTRSLILQRGDSLPGSLVVANLNRAELTSTGAAILEVYPVGGKQQFWSWNGSSFTRLYGLDDQATNGRITNIDLPVESGTGDLYGLVTQSDGPVRVMRYAAGAWTIIAQANSKVGNTQLWWLFRIGVVGKDSSIAVLADSPNGTGVFRLTAGNAELLASVQSSSNVNQIVGGASGVYLAGAISGTAAVYKLASGSAPAPLLSAGWQLPSPVTNSFLWDSVPERASGANPLMRQPGDVLARAGQSSAAVVMPGSTVGGDSVVSLGPAATSPDGKSTVFVALTGVGTALMHAHDGRVDLIGDTGPNSFSAGGQKVNWIDPNWPSPYMMNGSQQFIAMANTGPTSLWRFDLGTSQIQRIVTLQQPTPAGSSYNWISQAALDAAGNAAFLANLTDGSQALFLWTNGQTQKLLRTGETGLGGNQITGLTGVQFAGQKVVVNVGYKNLGNTVQAFDGANWTPVVAQGDALSFGRTVDNFVGPNLFANDAGDLAYEARTLGYASLLVRSRDGRDLVVAAASDPLPDGAWPVFFYGFNITAQGSVIFVAETFKDGKSRMTLYSAAPAGN